MPIDVSVRFRKQIDRLVEKSICLNTAVRYIEAVQFKFDVGPQ